MLALSIGKITYDITIPMDSYPVENSKIILKEKLEASGGSSSNVAALLGKWNVDSYFAGVVGYDEPGNNVKKELEAHNVHTQFMEVNYEKKTTSTFILTSKATTSRTQLMVEPEVYHLKKSDYDVLPDAIYTDGFEYSATLSAFNKHIIVLYGNLSNSSKMFSSIITIYFPPSFMCSIILDISFKMFLHIKHVNDSLVINLTGTLVAHSCISFLLFFCYNCFDT